MEIGNPPHPYPVNAKNNAMIRRLTLIPATLLVFILIAFIAPGTGSIKGRVSDNVLGTPLSFVTIAITQNGKVIAGASSDANGYYTISSLNPGTYDLKATYVGYKTAEMKSIVVADGQALTLNLSMENAPAPLSSVEIKSENQKLLFTSERKNAPAVQDPNNPGTFINAGKSGYLGYGYYKAPADLDSFDDPVMNTEEYDKINDNAYKLVNNDPLSTFSVDVDRASYSNMRRFLNQGSLPPKDAVRIEEMINYFTYNYPQPTGDDPFSINLESGNCPWNPKHKIVHVGLQGKRIETENLPNNNLVFLIDVSGSMSSADKLPLVKASLRLLVNELRPNDRVALVVYAGAAGRVLEPTAGNEKTKILGAIDKLEAGGSTAGGAGIELAYKTAREHFLLNGNNRVILCTDGDFNVGVSSDAELERMIEERRKDGVFLTVLGYGMGNYKDSKMEKLADKGNGNYAYIDNLQEANKTLVTEMGGTLVTIAKDVKIQVEFNPSQVKAYRLIGYENRILNKEDFNDDKKDAGEIGAGHTVTALYEIIPASSDEVIPGVDPLKYQQPVKLSPAANNGEMLTIKFRYKAPKEDVSKLLTRTLNNTAVAPVTNSENFLFASAVVEFGMLLRDSQYKGESDWKKMIARAKSAKGLDDGGYRAEFIRLAETAHGLSKATASNGRAGTE
ncbi:MAG: uncharacterized protein FD123_3279 [Bacteroidetes bacterium]|nr:MAG: uncharacterized protein FD123_3279 [Bacteroidota bacterium]